MTSAPQPQVVTHQADLHRFSVNNEALLEYHLTGTSVDFHHTFVPPSMRGQGIAEKLVRSGLAWATAEQLTIKASCSYVQKFLKG